MIRSLAHFTVQLVFIMSLYIGVAVAYEGSGTLYKDTQGALPKSLWRDQPRSEILFLLEELPASSPYRNVQLIKKNMLLSQYDTSLINNDVSPDDGNDLLTPRLEKLFEMGFWDEAHTLYTSLPTQPQNNNDLAQIGITLTLAIRNMSTACLEQKVLRTQYQSDYFWKQIDEICRLEIESEDNATANFTDSPALQQIYSNSNYKIATSNLSNLAPIELIIALKKGRIDYTGVIIDKNLPPLLTRTFLNDPLFPEPKKVDLTTIAQQQAILNLPAITASKEISDLNKAELFKLLSTKLMLNEQIDTESLEKLEALSETHQLSRYYFLVLNLLNNKNVQDYGNLGGSSDIINLAPPSLSKNYGKSMEFIHFAIDTGEDISNTQFVIYEKRIDIKFQLNSLRNSIEWLDETSKHNYQGMSLLILLNHINNNDTWMNRSEGNSDVNAFNMLNSLSKVGLIEQASMLAREELAIMMKKKN